MESAGLTVNPRHVVLGHFRTEDGRACRDILRDHDRPTAIFAANDAVALGVLQAAHEVGLRVPEDLSVIGFDDSHAAVEATPQLTTVRQPLFDMGRMAIRSTMSVLRGDPRITTHIEVATTLVERDSTGPLQVGQPAPRHDGLVPADSTGTQMGPA
jgi:DNA-binding LacI/PurR family transcriptional regulator